MVQVGRSLFVRSAALTSELHLTKPWLSISENSSNPEIAQELYISDTTVKTHITHIFQKLGIRDRVQAVVLAYQSGLFAADAPQAAGGDERATD